MANNECPFHFRYQGMTLCALGENCHSKTSDQRTICEHTNTFFHKGMTQDEINKMKEKVVRNIKKKTVPVETYQIAYKLDSVTSDEKRIDEKKKELQEKIKGYKFE